jgi:hypothetical protein
MDDADLQQAVREDLQWERRVDAAHGAPSGVAAHRRRVWRFFTGGPGA